MQSGMGIGAKAHPGLHPGYEYMSPRSPQFDEEPRKRGCPSKGGYVVRWAEPAGTRIIADDDWFVP